MSHVNVIVMKPFWRYCVIPRGQLAEDRPAIPFYRGRNAVRLAVELADSGAIHSPVLVFKRRWWRWRTVEPEPVLSVVSESRPPVSRH